VTHLVPLATYVFLWEMLNPDVLVEALVVQNPPVFLFRGERRSRFPLSSCPVNRPDLGDGLGFPYLSSAYSL